MTLEDESGFANLVVWEKVFKQYRTLILTSWILGVTGRLQIADGVVHVIAESFWKPEFVGREPEDHLVQPRLPVGEISPGVYASAQKASLVLDFIVREVSDMLLFATLGAVLVIAAMGLVMLMSGANSFPGRPVNERSSRAAIRRTDKVKAA